MLKKITALILFFICVLGVWSINNTPIFQNYSDTFEIYLDSASSSARVVKTDKNHFAFIKGIKGESCKVSLEEFDLDYFLSEFSAKIVLVEEIDNGVSYYAYSQKIPYTENIDGKKVNLHVFIGKRQITLGTPIIYGSF